MQGKEFNKPLLSKELWLIFMPFGTATIYDTRNAGELKGVRYIFR